MGVAGGSAPPGGLAFLLGVDLVEPVVEDSTGSVDLALEKTRKLLETDQVVALFGGSTSDIRKAILPAIEEAGSLLFYTAPFEGYERSPNVFYLGPDPAQQVLPAMQYLLGQENSAFAQAETATQDTNSDATARDLQPKTRFVLVGTEGVYSRAIHTILKEQLRLPIWRSPGSFTSPLPPPTSAS